MGHMNSKNLLITISNLKIARLHVFVAREGYGPYQSSSLLGISVGSKCLTGGDLALACEISSSQGSYPWWW